MADSTGVNLGAAQALESRWDNLADKVLAPEPPQDPAPQAPATPDPAIQGAPQEPESEDYSSVEEYLQKAGIERDSFYALPTTVKVDGKEMSVPLADLLKSYGLEKHFHEKSVAFSEQQKAWETERAQVKGVYEQQLKDAKSLSDFAKQQLLSEFSSVNWNELYTQDPARWSALQLQFNNRAGAIEQHLQKIRSEEQRLAKEQEDALRNRLPQEQEKLFESHPEWRDEKTFSAARTELRSYAKGRGFTAAEIDSIFDHRYMNVLHDAARYAALQAQKPEALKRVREAPKSAQPGARITRDPKVAANQQAREAWAKDRRNVDKQVAYFDTLT